VAQRKFKQDEAGNTTVYQARPFDLSRLQGISSQTIETHLGLYRGYVEQLNELVSESKATASSADGTASRVRRFAFEYNGVVLHELFFEQLSGPGSPQWSSGSVVAEAADIAFGGTEEWRRDIYALAATRGVGWVVCARDSMKNRIFNTWVDLHHLAFPASSQLLFVLDFWEHAYLLDFAPQERTKYLDTLWEQIDWGVVERRAR
jgi:Fe-Mn family superoxide dismutase